MLLFKKFAAAAAILVVAALTACGSQSGTTQTPAAVEETTPASVEETTPAAVEETTPVEVGDSAPATDSETVPAEGSEPFTVVAVSKSIGDLWLLSGGELAGMTEDGMELEGITENTKVIGTVTNPSLEAIAALSPDLVLLSGELPTHKKLAEELQSRDIHSKMISVNSFSDYEQVMKELTGMTGKEDCYKKNVTDVGGRINKALKNDYFACEIFNAFGLQNIAQDNSALDELNLEAILDADPDIIFVIEQGKSEEAQESFAEEFSGKPVWQELTAVRNGCVFTLPKDYFQYKPNSKWDEAYRYVMELLEEK